MAAVERTTATPDETEALAADLGRAAVDGTLIGLVGELGAGKTAFVRGLARGLGIDPERVHSPTFTIATAYPDGRLRLQHVDLYRFDGPLADDPWLRETVWGGDGVTAVEWFDRIADPGDDVLVVRFHVTGPAARRLRFEPHGARHGDVLARMFRAA